MKTIKTFIIILFALVIGLMPTFYPNIGGFSHAVDGQIIEYDVYDEENNLLTTKSDIEIGDVFITSNFYEYQIYKIEGRKGFAVKLREIEPPKIYRQKFPKRRTSFKKLGLYMTHNDESYTLSDGYDSVYGAGGIHDVAEKLGKEFASRGVDVVLDETLHIPHDSSAYTRSGVTAKRLMNNEYPNALFDIHRDGVSRKLYYTSIEGQDFSKIRIVVGKSNPNYEENYAFAQKVFALGASMYPWLFLDIYSGKGHYNQALQNTNLLFEMGTYLIEKEFVYNSIPYLVDVLETALYDSVANGDDEIIVDDLAPNTNDIIIGEDNDNAVDNNTMQTNDNKRGLYIAIIASASMACLIIIGGVLLFRKSQNKNISL